MGDRVGQRLGNYHLLRLLGRGTFAEVYLGEHALLKSYAALKVLHRFLADQDQEDFIAEGYTLVRLKHEHIVRLLDFDIIDDVPFLVMEYAPGGTLRRRYPRQSCLPVEVVVSYVRQMAEALDYAHGLSVVHRDVKPENMLLGEHGEILLGDFGIATMVHATQARRVEYQQAGTLPYMAPEQLQKSPLPASDQYALGIVAYEWLCGERPFLGNEWTLIHQHLSVTPPPLREKNIYISPAVEAVVMRALAKRPDERFSNVREFAAALARAASSHFFVPPQKRPVGPEKGQVWSPPAYVVHPQEDIAATLTRSTVATRLLRSPLPGDRITSAIAPDRPGYFSSEEVSSPVTTSSREKRRLAPWGMRVLFILFSLVIAIAGAFFAIGLDHAHFHMMPEEHESSHHDNRYSRQERREQTYREVTAQSPVLDVSFMDESAENWTSNRGCVFKEDGYHVREYTRTLTQECLTHRSYQGDFAFQVEMAILDGNGGGLIIHSIDARYSYHFAIDRDGSYSLTIGSMPASGDDVASTESSAIGTGVQQKNILTVISRRERLSFYINGTYVDQIRDYRPLSGDIGMFATRYQDGPAVELLCRNAKMWEF